MSVTTSSSSSSTNVDDTNLNSFTSMSLVIDSLEHENRRLKKLLEHFQKGKNTRKLHGKIEVIRNYKLLHKQVEKQQKWQAYAEEHYTKANTKPTRDLLLEWFQKTEADFLTTFEAYIPDPKQALESTSKRKSITDPLTPDGPAVSIPDKEAVSTKPVKEPPQKRSRTKRTTSLSMKN